MKDWIEDMAAFDLKKEDIFKLEKRSRELVSDLEKLSSLGEGDLLGIIDRLARNQASIASWIKTHGPILEEWIYSESDRGR